MLASLLASSRARSTRPPADSSSKSCKDGGRLGSGGGRWCRVWGWGLPQGAS